MTRFIEEKLNKNVCPYLLLSLVTDKRIWFKYKKFYSKSIKQQYILCDNKHFINDFDIDNYAEWLNKYWNKLIFISDSTYCSLEFVINTGQYSIINGLTIILALHKINVLKTKILYPTLEKFVATKSLFQNIPYKWNSIYYNSIPNIADFPILYLSTGPHWAHEKIINLFRHYDDVDYPYFNYNKYSSCYTHMLPYFNINHWKVHELYYTWLDVSDNDDASIYPNIRNFLIAITSKKSSYKFFVANFDKFINTIINSFRHKKEAWWIVFSILNELYLDVEFNQKYRLRKVWYYFLIKAEYLHQFIFLSLIKIFDIQICLPFLLDTFRYKIDIYHKYRFLLNVRRSSEYVLLESFDSDYNVINTSLMKLLKNTNHIYYKNKVEKNVATKLFGIKYLPAPINTIMLHYYQHNKHLLL